MASTNASSDMGSIGRPPVSARTRVLVAFAAGALASGIAIPFMPWQVATLAGWNVTAVVYIGWVWLSVARLDGVETAKLATAEDNSRRAAEFILMAACGASLVGVGLTLLEASGKQDAAKGLIIAVASLSVVLSWAAVHTVFTLRYASLYYLHGGGIDFNDDHPPDYGDFAYVAFTIGMTYQVSDTALTAKLIRMTALRHAFLSYVFGVAVVAMVINIVSGLL